MEESNRNKYLTLVIADESKDTLKKRKSCGVKPNILSNN